MLKLARCVLWKLVLYSRLPLNSTNVENIQEFILSAGLPYRIPRNEISICFEILANGDLLHQKFIFQVLEKYLKDDESNLANLASILNPLTTNTRSHSYYQSSLLKQLFSG